MTIGNNQHVSVDIADDVGTLLHSDVPYATSGNGFYTEELSDAGAFQVDFPEDGTGSADLVPGNMVRFNVDGVPDRTYMIEKVVRRPVQRFASERIRTVSGRDIVAQFGDCPVDPPLGITVKPVTRTIRFDWTHPDLDRSGWFTPVYLGPVYSGNVLPDGETANPVALSAKDGWHPDGWPDVFSGWIWRSAVDGSGSHPVNQTCYFYHDYPVSGPEEEEKPFLMVFTADDVGQLAFDGTVLDSGVDPPAVQWNRCTASPVPQVSGGTHHIAAKVTNTVFDTDYEIRGNPGAMAFTSYRPGPSPALQNQVTYALVPDIVPIRTGQNVNSPEPSLGGGWKCWTVGGAGADGSSPPGFTVGRAFEILFGRVKVHDYLPGWTLTFNGTVDSAGNAWPVTDELTASTADSLLDTMLAWYEQGHWEFAAGSNGVGSQLLYAYRYGERGNFDGLGGGPAVVTWDSDNVDRVEAEWQR